MKLPCLSARRAPLLGLFTLAAPLVASAQQSTTVVRYTFSSLDGTAATVAPGASASMFTRDPSDTTVYDNTAGNPAPDANSNDWSTGVLLDPSLFYTFTLTPGAGGASWNALSFDVARFDVQGIDDGPASFAARQPGWFHHHAGERRDWHGIPDRVGAAERDGDQPGGVYRVYGYNAWTA